jgi:hypothetical protein
MPLACPLMTIIKSQTHTAIFHPTLFYSTQNALNFSLHPNNPNRSIIFPCPQKHLGTKDIASSVLAFWRKQDYPGLCNLGHSSIHPSTSGSHGKRLSVRVLTREREGQKVVDQTIAQLSYTTTENYQTMTRVPAHRTPIARQIALIGTNGTSFHCQHSICIPQREMI